MHNTIIRHFSYITKEITRVRLEKGIVEIRYIQVIGLSRRSPGENPAPCTPVRRSRKRHRAGGDSDGVKPAVGGRRSHRPRVPPMERSGTLHGDQSSGGGRAVPRSSHDSAAKIKEEDEQEIEEGERKKKREMGEERRRREKERERDTEGTISASASSALPPGTTTTIVGGGRTTTIQRRKPAGQRLLHRECDDRDRLTNLVTWSLSESVCRGQRHPPEELRDRLFVRTIAYRLLRKLTVLRCRNGGGCRHSMNERWPLRDPTVHWYYAVVCSRRVFVYFFSYFGFNAFAAGG